MKYEIKSMDAGGRVGLLSHNGKKMITPTIFPVFSPFSNLIPPEEILTVFGGSTIFTNAYILYNNLDMRKKALDLGLHRFMDFNGLIATDSGAFQYYMYGNDEDIEAEDIEKFQEVLKSDFPVILDIPVQLSDTYEVAERKVKDSILRAEDNINRRKNSSSAWFGPIHGSQYPKLVRKSAEGMSKLDFGIYAIGGVVKTFNNYQFDISINALLNAKQILPSNRPIHLFGAGLPQFFALSVACGADTMDSAAYILFAKQGRYMSLRGTKHIEDLNELPCSCPVCCAYTAKEINHKYNSKDSDQRNHGIELIARHNLHISFTELKTIREAIREGVLWDLVESRMQAHPKLISAYNHVRKYWPYFESLEPTERNQAPFYLSNNSFVRPIFYRIFRRLFKNYSIPSGSSVFLLPEIDATLYNSPSLMEWTRKILKYVKRNETINQDINDKNNVEIIFISNIFGFIPMKLADVYPFSQREWFMEYSRNPVENAYIKNVMLEKDENIGKKSMTARNSVVFNSYIINNDDPKRELMQSMQDSTGTFIYLNRGQLVYNLLDKNKDSIEKMIILRPEAYTTSGGRVQSLELHLIDDIITLIEYNWQDKKEKYKVIEQLANRL